MSDVLMKCVLLLTCAALVLSTSSCTQDDTCGQPMPQQARALLQARAEPSGSALEVRVKTQVNVSQRVNPSGAAAPLDQSGYEAVADRCCQAEMQEFIRRQALDLGYDVCDAAGLRGIVPYHSCEKGIQTFTALTANLLKDSAERCTWLASRGTCNQHVRPSDCPDFTGTPLPDCGCSRSKAAKLDFAAGSVVSNLGGVGPDTTAAAELRYSNVGTSETGQKFDLVVTTLTPSYTAPKPEKNGVNSGGKFGNINMQSGSSTDFQFSFMVPGTNTPLTLTEVHMAVFDLDGNPAADVESTSSKGYAGYVTDANPSSVATLTPDGRTQFTANANPYNVDNPQDPMNITPEQRKACVMYFYKNVDKFELTFSIAGPPQSYGRNLAFFFDSALSDRCGP